MPRLLSFRQGLLSVLFWSIISAAFIGPGTVTTASRAGAAYGLDLLWALAFSIIATIFLQEAAARITIASGKSLGEVISLRYQGRRQVLKILLFGAVAFGCAAYQAGNLLGALSGLVLLAPFSKTIWTLAVGAVCAAFLWVGNFRIIANLLALVVAGMGVAFCYVAFYAELPSDWAATALTPPLVPAGGALLVIGLIGTTIVPYNLFLASGISQGQQIAEMRWGLVTAILIGGLISVAIMVVGTQVAGEFSFATLAETMAAKLGAWAVVFFGMGLFAAGLSSSVTAPLAAAVTARSLFGSEHGTNWATQSRNFRRVWGAVLGVGLIFGLLDVQPVPAIILAQAVNGLLLPVVAIFLLLAVNDAKLLPAGYRNSRWANWVFLIIVGVTCLLGLTNISKVLIRLFPIAAAWPWPEVNGLLAGGISLVLGWWLWRLRGRTKGLPGAPDK